MSSQFASNPSVQRPPPLTVCPTPPESIAFPTYWYRLPDDDDLLICTKCYEDKLRSTRFASLLRCDYLDFGPGTEATCDFDTPRIDSLLRQAIASNDLQPLRSFAKQRLNITSCQGVQGVKGGNDVSWFKPVNDDISGFVCCEACYEDVVLGTSFEPQFVPYPQRQPADAVWACDLAIPYLKHSLQEYARSADWGGFAQAARHRMSLPTCVRDVPALASAKRWYNTVRPSPIRNMTLCEACFFDRVGWQRNVPAFRSYSIRSARNYLPSDLRFQAGRHGCLFRHTAALWHVRDVASSRKLNNIEADMQPTGRRRWRMVWPTRSNRRYPDRREFRHLCRLPCRLEPKRRLGSPVPPPDLPTGDVTSM